MTITRCVGVTLLIFASLHESVHGGQGPNVFETFKLVNVERLGGGPDISKVLEWIAAASDHQPGQIDEGLRKVASWPPATLALTLTDAVSLLRLSLFLHAQSDGAEAEYRGHKFRVTFPPAPVPLKPVDNLDAYLRLKPEEVTRGAVRRMLTRGAILQTDLAMYVALGGSVNTSAPLNPTTESLVSHKSNRSGAPPTVVASPMAPAPASASNVAIHVSDGEAREMEDAGPYWHDAQFIVEALDRRSARTADPRTEPLVSFWYRTVSAWAAYQARWSDAQPLLERGLLLFPDDARLLFDAGVLHEAFAEPNVQHAAQNLVRSGTITGVVSLGAELQMAKTHLEAAIARDSGLAEVRLHLGHVLGRLGRHEDALRELAVAERELPDRELRYDATLLLARAQASLGDRDTARASYERAAAAFPLAQSPQVGLSQLSCLDGDGQAAVARLVSLLSQPSRDGTSDPWWNYVQTHSRDGLALLAAMRGAFLRDDDQ